MNRRRRFGLATLVAIAMLLAALVPSGAAAPHGISAWASSPAGPATKLFPTTLRHEVVVYLENQELKDVLANASYERYLSQKYAFATEYYSIGHFSLPNYLAATSGISPNLFKLSPAKNVGDLVERRGLTWGAFMQSMPVPCDNKTAGLYTIVHNPFIMYSDVYTNQSRCRAHDQNFTAWQSAVSSGTLPTYSFLSPDQHNNSRFTNLTYADNWLRGWLTPLINSTAFNNTVVFVLYDEGTSTLGAHGKGGGHIFLTAVSNQSRMGYRSPIAYDDFDLLTTTEWLFSLGRTGHNDNWSVNPPMRDLFRATPLYAVSGIVSTTTGHAIASPNVTLDNRSTLVGGMKGGYQYNLPDGRYTLTANATGHGSQTLSVTVLGASVANVNFTLTAPRRPDARTRASPARPAPD